MRRPLAALLGSALAAGLGLTLLSPPATAATKRFTDAAGDVRVVTYTIGDQDAPPSEPSDSAVGDVVATRLTHGVRRISATMRFRELTPGADDSGYYFYLRGSNGQRRLFAIAIPPGRPQGLAHLLRGHRAICKRDIEHRVDYVADTLTFSIPRRCIGSPAFVRLRGVAYTGDMDESNETYRYFYDSPFRTGGEGPQALRAASAAIGRG